MLGPLRNPDVSINIGQENCTGVNVAATIVTCRPPPSQPRSLMGAELPQVVVSLLNNALMAGFSLKTQILIQKVSYG